LPTTSRSPCTSTVAAVQPDSHFFDGASAMNDRSVCMYASFMASLSESGKNDERTRKWWK
jgi:hypothetical protein